jgi:replicative DNA helicase
MKLSAPIYHLKRKARQFAREQGIPLHAALDRIAAAEGFREWSLLASRASAGSRADELFGRLRPGELVLIGARPGQGKTRLSLELALRAMRSGNRAALFTLEYTRKGAWDLFRSAGADRARFERLFDFEDVIGADHIVRKLCSAPRGTLVVVDYLQLLDQKRDDPPLMDQVRTLRSFARDRELIVVCPSQID